MKKNLNRYWELKYQFLKKNSYTFIRKSKYTQFLNRDNITILIKELKIGVLVIKLMQLIDDINS